MWRAQAHGRKVARRGLHRHSRCQGLFPSAIWVQSGREARRLGQRCEAYWRHDRQDSPLTPVAVAVVTISVLLMKPLPIALYLRRRAPHHCGDLYSIPDNWADVCGFLKPPGSQKFWKVNKHGAFSIPRQTLGLRTHDQSCHHETWLHLHFVDWSNQWNHQARYNGNLRLTERPTHAWNRAPKCNICQVLSDQSLSSQRTTIRTWLSSADIQRPHDR